ncbi:hypothetical protein VNI00_006914 [Paramarasmius palmivorus]|uniref:Uncharacterized protein n=1 Tax=Paramarasmius palmivorus TaxID=297713 RepID=A0AAW0D7R7_9AGAR
MPVPLRSSNSVLYNGRPTDHLNEPLLEQHWLTDSDNATIMSFFSSNLDYTISSNIESLDLTPPQEAFAPLYNYAAPIFEFPESSCLSALPKPASYLEESQLFFQEETMRSCFPLPHVQPAVGLEPVLATLFSRSEASTSSLTYLPTSDQPSASFSREGYSLGDSFTAPGTFEASAPVLPFPEADCHPSRSPSSASFMSLSSMSDSHDLQP